MMKPTDPVDRCDDRLRELFRREAFPPTPRLDVRSLARVDVSAALASWGAGLAVAALLMVAVVLWRQSPQREETPVVATGRSAHELHSRDKEQAEWPESRVLFSIPPVDALEVLTDQQSAYLALLQHIE